MTRDEIEQAERTLAKLNRLIAAMTVALALIVCASAVQRHFIAPAETCGAC